MTLREKLRVARALAELRVDIIEAGFPAASPGDFESVKAIADENLGPVICGLARCNPGDIEKVHAGRAKAPTSTAFTYSSRRARFTASTSSRWPRKKSSRALSARYRWPESFAMTWSSPRKTPRAQSSAYLAEVVSAAIEAGASTVNIPGYRRIHGAGGV